MSEELLVCDVVRKGRDFGESKKDGEGRKGEEDETDGKDL
jgi:hypothetical protein